MTGAHDPRRLGHPPGQPFPVDDGYGHRPSHSALRRFLGGSPVAVLIRLVLLSILVGATMAMFGLTPGQLFWRLYDAARTLIDISLETFHDFGSWILAGAIVVVPLWLISRLFAMNR